MVDRVEQIVATLPELMDVTDVCEVADRRLAQGDAAFVVELVSLWPSGTALPPARYGSTRASSITLCGC